eukprot:11318201-Alexandrium_andersonii.AAC.1
MAARGRSGGAPPHALSTGGLLSALGGPWRAAGLPGMGREAGAPVSTGVASTLRRSRRSRHGTATFGPQPVVRRSALPGAGGLASLGLGLGALLG